MKTADLCRDHGISAATFYQWKAKYGGLEVSEAQRLKKLEEENGRLKRIVADQAIDLRELASKHSRYGYRRLTAKLRQRGMQVNPKRVWRLCRQERLQIPKIRRRRLMRRLREWKGRRGPINAGPWTL